MAVPSKLIFSLLSKWREVIADRVSVLSLSVVSEVRAMSRL